MANCTETIAANIGLDCDHPIEGGYTGRGVYIPMEANPQFVTDASNPRIVKAITLAQDAKVCVIDNASPAPFDGSTTTGNNDAGYARFVKALAIRIPARGAKVSKEVVEPLVKSGRGGVLVVEKVDRCGDGSFEIIGMMSPAKCVDPSTVTRSETANGGATSVTLQATESYFEVTLFDTDYSKSLEVFEGLLAKGFNA